MTNEEKLKLRFEEAFKKFIEIYKSMVFLGDQLDEISNLINKEDKDKSLKWN